MTKAEIKELMDFFGEKQGINELKIKDKDRIIPNMEKLGSFKLFVPGGNK